MTGNQYRAPFETTLPLVFTIKLTFTLSCSSLGYFLVRNNMTIIMTVIRTCCVCDTNGI